MCCGCSGGVRQQMGELGLDFVGLGFGLVWDLGSRGLRLPKRPKLKQVCANRSSIGLTPARRGSCGLNMVCG